MYLFIHSYIITRLDKCFLLKILHILFICLGLMITCDLICLVSCWSNKKYFLSPLNIYSLFFTVSLPKNLTSFFHFYEINIIIVLRTFLKKYMIFFGNVLHFLKIIIFSWIMKFWRDVTFYINLKHSEHYHYLWYSQMEIYVTDSNNFTMFSELVHNRRPGSYSLGIILWEWQHKQN